MLEFLTGKIHTVPTTGILTTTAIVGLTTTGTTTGGDMDTPTITTMPIISMEMGGTITMATDGITIMDMDGIITMVTTTVMDMDGATDGATIIS